MAKVAVRFGGRKQIFVFVPDEWLNRIAARGWPEAQRQKPGEGTMNLHTVLKWRKTLRFRFPLRHSGIATRQAQQLWQPQR
jgi:hypothetical protein